jgi:hypothetical protein
MDAKHIPGRGCTCEAWNESECACGADWRSSRQVELEAAAALLIAVHDYHEAAMIQPHPDAPGHGHMVAGRWDRDGSECEWCATWNKVREFVRKEIERATK